MANYAAIKTEINTDPLGRGYSGMDDVAITTSLNTVNIERNKTSLTGSEILNNVDATEWGALTDADRQVVWNIVHLGTINPFGVEATLLINVFGGGSTTITALAAARTELISRSTQLGLGNVRIGDVIRAQEI